MCERYRGGDYPFKEDIQLVIVEGESGPIAHPMQEQLMLDIQQQCK